MVLGQLAADVAPKAVLEDFADLEAADIPAALEYAAVAVQERELPPIRSAKFVIDASAWVARRCREGSRRAINSQLSQG